MTNVFNVTTPDEGTDGKIRFREVGVAFLQKEGSKSFMSIQLYSLPVSGNLVIFEKKSKDQRDA